MRTWLAVFCLVASSASAQTVRTFALQNVFVTYVEHPTHWTDLAVTGPNFTAQINTFWHSAAGSWGAITYTNGGTLGWLDTTITTTGCPTGAFYTAVNAAYGTVPVGTIRQIVMPPGTPCNSQAQQPGNTLWTVGGGYKEHEIGHTLGLAHSPAQYPNGSTQPQGPYSVMGDGTYGDAIPTYQRMQLNLFSPTFTLATVTGPVGGTVSQDVTLQFVDTMTPGVKGLIANQLVKNAFGQLFTTTLATVEFRGGDYLSTGVIIRNTSGTLLTMNPAQQNYWRMVLGQRWCASGNSVCVTLTAQTSTTATVHIDIGGTSLPSPINHTR